MTKEHTTFEPLDLLKDLAEKKCHRKMNTPKDFDILVKSIQDSTHQMLNASTLKRFYGYVGNVKIPRESTLDILCQYVGYASWQDFVYENTKENTNDNKDETVEDVEKVETEEKIETVTNIDCVAESESLHSTKKGRPKFAFIVILTIVLVCLGGWWLFPSHRAEDVGFKFVIHSPEDSTLYFKVIDHDSAFVALIAKDDSIENTYKGDVTVPNTVTYNGITYTVREIASRAFFHCPDLVSINLPSTLRVINERSFQEDDSIAIINIPDSVNIIKLKAMKRCRWMRNVHLPEQLKEIPEACFFFDSMLVSVEVPRNVKVVGRDAFACCIGLKEVKLPSGLKKLSRGVFWECHGLESITIPAKVSEFGDFVFWGCDHLKDIYMLNPKPPRITDIFHNIHLTIHVPASSVEAYRNALFWEDQKIVGM